MNKKYRKFVLVMVTLSLLLGLGGAGLKYGVFQGIMASKEERTNTQCTTTQRVFDEAKVLNAQQEKDLQALIAKKEKITGADMVLLTIREPSLDDYTEIRDFAQKYYEENQFGWDKPNGDGIIYVDNWATGYCWMCTTGKAKEKLDDRTVKYIIDRTNETVNSTPYKAYKTMMEETAAEMQNLHLFHFHVKTWWLLAGALVLTAVFAGVNLMKNKGEVTTNQYTYVPKRGMKVNRKQDIFLRSHVTRTRIERNHDAGGGGEIGGSDGHGGAGGRH